MLSKRAPFNNGLRLKTLLPYVCHRCRIRTALLNIQSRKLPVALQLARRNSTTASTTAINGNRGLPETLQNLHSSLSALQKDAALYINWSQLLLALRSVESKNAVIRVAVLGIGEQLGPRRLVRALLADPLKPEPEWERQLLGAEDADGRGLLLRYRENPDFDQRHPLYRTLSIPSSMLKAHNLEILIQAISAGRNDERHDYLIPSIDAPNIVRDSPSKMTFPVHKALILAGSLQEISMLATQFPAASLDSRNEWHMVRGIIHGHWSNLKSGLDVESIIGVTNIDNAEGAIQAFRDSPGLAMEYERLWFDSGLGDVLTWVLAGIDGNTTLKPVLKRFIENICLSAIRSMAQEREKLDKQDREFAHRAANIRAKLNQGLVAWAELGHNELRDQLGSAFRSKNWKKLVWWKLFWRADDVGYITSDILQRCWLVQAEKAMIWHSGRINQASRVEVTENPQSVPRFTKKLEPPKPKIGDLAPSPLIADIVAELIPQKDIDAAYGELFTGFWPQDISRGRSSLLNTTIPPLQSVCQRLLFQTISTVLLTSSLSSLLYISISTTSIYEAGAIAAFGLIYSMRRLQKEWTLARDDWEANVREEGRKVLRRTEEQMKASLSEDFISSPDATSEEHKILAKSAIERVREDLDRLTNQVNNDDRDGVPEDLRAVKDEAG